MAPLYNPQGTWSATVQYTYLDSVQYGTFTYICTASGGSLNQEPDTSPLVWVQMPVITQEDQYYLRSREDLLQYEDARFQSLINAMANYYLVRNDQNIWGSFLRAVAIELARIEYMYSYDVVSKNPQYLTPPDIKREYANPLFVTGNFQQLSQFDSGDFGASFGAWAADTGFIPNAAILDSNGNIQIATTPGTTGAVEPAWATSLGATTTDGEVVWTNAGPAPESLAYPIGYRDMLVDLLAAYQLGATPTSIQDVIYAYTGKNIIVEELYKQIGDGFYDQSDRNSIKVSVNVGGSDPLTDIESLTELQQITNSLYGAIDLAKPAHVGLEFTTVFGADENIDCFLTPRYLTQIQLNTLAESQAAYYSLIGYVLTQNTLVGWSPEKLFNVGDIIQDPNGNIQLVIADGFSGLDQPIWSKTVQGVTLDYYGDVSSPPLSPPVSPPVSPPISSPPASPPTSVLTWVNIGTQQITIAAYNALSTPQQPNYQGYYQDVNCVGPGIDDTLQIIIQQVEEPPYDPMLYQAPIFDVNNPTTTLAAYGRVLLSPISSTIWQSLSSVPQVWSSATTYFKGTLVRGRSWTTPGSFNAGTWTPGGWALYRANKKNTNHDPLADAAETYWTPLESPSIYQAYYPLPNGLYALGMQQWAPATTFYVGQFMVDNNGNLQIAVIAGDALSSPPIAGVSSPVVSIDTSQQHEVVVDNNIVTILVPSTSAMGLVVGTSLVTLLNYTYAIFLNGLTLPVIAFTATSISMSLTYEGSYDSAGQAETGTAQIGFSQSATVPTYDGTIVWEYLGANYLTVPNKWIEVVNTSNVVTGEVANWNVVYPFGLLAPRTDNVWELSGDTFSSFEME